MLPDMGRCSDGAYGPIIKTDYEISGTWTTLDYVYFIEAKGSGEVHQVRSTWSDETQSWSVQHVE